MARKLDVAGSRKTTETVNELIPRTEWLVRLVACVTLTNNQLELCDHLTARSGSMKGLR